MEKPELIEQRIEELKNQLQESKKYYQFELICTSKRSDKMIGFFNIRNGEKILTLLNDGSRLQYRHGVFGDVDVWMNPQRNRILVSKNNDINEDNIMSYIFWHTGEWYLNTEM
jgi:hypothetical protein